MRQHLGSHTVAWREWMEDLDHLESPAPVYARPAGLGSLGSESYFIEPYKVRSPHRVRIGDGVGVGARAFLSVISSFKGQEYEPTLEIGDETLISTDLFVHCSGDVHVGKRVGISARVYIGDSTRDYSDPDVMGEDMEMGDALPVRIEDGAGLGIGSIVLPGVTIGERAIVSAGSVVTRDVPPRAVVFGNPARVVKSWDEESGGWVTGPLRRSGSG